MKLIIPLAGKGTRLRPHTLTKPKPLLKVAGKTILEYLLKSVEDVKFSEVIFITNNQKDRIEEFIKSRYSFKATYVEQKVADGSGGALMLVKDLVDEDVLILFSDTIADADLSIIKKVQKDKNVDGIIWVKEVEDYQRFGVVVRDNNNFMTKIVEKPKEPISKLANIGLYYFKNHKMLFEGLEYIHTNNIIIDGEYYLVDAIQYMIQHGSKIITAPVRLWNDCGKVETLLETNQSLMKRAHSINSKTKDTLIIPPVFIDKNVVVENSIIGPYVSVASGTEIKGCILQNSIIDVNSRLENIKLKDSVIGESAVLKSHFKRLNVGDYSELHFYS